MTGSANDGRKDGSGRIITGESGLAHTGTIVAHQSGNVFVAHLRWKLTWKVYSEDLKLETKPLEWILHPTLAYFIQERSKTLAGHSRPTHAAGSSQKPPHGRPRHKHAAGISQKWRQASPRRWSSRAVSVRKVVVQGGTKL